ncbi:MAG: tRNA pseudouridine(55) synthase TruB [Bacteroidia bacterium]
METLQATIDYYNGEVILINKPYKWTSFDVVNKLRIILKKHLSNSSKLKVGHAGTLDPLATGLLIICTGKLTKEINSYQAQEKEYTGSFYIGAATPSFDLETKPDYSFSISHITEDLILETSKKFTGKVLQSPPVHSAVKVNGLRAYKNARKGIETKILSREVFIHQFEITKIEMPLVYFRVVCSKGTYIRALANDFGKALNSGAYLHSLCRTCIGEFKIDNALSVEEFIASVNKHFAAAVVL